MEHRRSENIIFKVIEEVRTQSTSFSIVEEVEVITEHVFFMKCTEAEIYEQ